MPVTFTFEDSVTQRQRLWAEGAYLNAQTAGFPTDLLDLTLTVRTVPEPPCAGHKDYMCTTMTDGHAATIAIREGADDQTRAFNRWLADLGPGSHDPISREIANRTDISEAERLRALASVANARRGIPSLDVVRRWFQEAFVHEIMHALTFGYLALTNGDKTQLASWFRYGKTATGEGERFGQLADWSPLDKPWEDRIVEAVAEFLKDVYLPATARVQDNHTNWDFMEEHFTDILEKIETAIGCSRTT